MFCLCDPTGVEADASLISVALRVMMYHYKKAYLDDNTREILEKKVIHSI
jgi:hypothetical protein